LALARGYLLIIDYGHEADRLFDQAHADGTLRSYSRHLVDLPGASGVAARSGPPWLQSPGEQDLTAHVDFTAITRSAERAGLSRLGSAAQGHFLLSLGLADRLAAAAGPGLADVRRRLAARTLVLPGGLASTHTALLFGRDAPAIIQFPDGPRQRSPAG
jgi:SAM-dependent MidA family methyltransferase